MRRFLLVFFLFALLAVLAGCGEADPVPADHVFSHRGASGEELEHTTAAYDLAVAYGSAYLEQDLVQSAAGTLYVSHDWTPERLTGETRPFAELTDAEIDALRTSDGQPILKLRDVFSAYGDRVHYVIEVRNTDQAAALIDLAKEFGLEEQLVVQAWNTPELLLVQAELPAARRLLLVEDQSGLDWAILQPCVDIVGAKDPLMSEFNCRWVHEHGKQLCVWTLNTAAEIRSAIELGVDYYFTDYTAKALLLEQQYRVS